MALRVLSWNVEHFRNGGKIKAVAEHIQSHAPDVFALYEVENLSVLKLMRDHFPDYAFHITDGPETQEILVGFRNNGRMESDLDHVLASSGLKVKNLGTRGDGGKYQVAVRGWQQLAGAKRDRFISDVSDHCALVFEVEF